MEINNIDDCGYLLNDIQRIWISKYQILDYSILDNIIIDIFNQIDWQEILFSVISIQSDYTKLFSTAIKIEIEDIINEINFIDQNNLIVIFEDKNSNFFIVLDPMRITDIVSNLDTQTNKIGFTLLSENNNGVKQIDSNYYTFNL